MSSHLNTLFKQLLLVLLTIPIAVSALAGQSEDLFERGNLAYTAGKFSEAVQYYQDVAGERGVSASLLYNLANAYAALGETGEAILAYEQALRLDYRNKDIRANLAAVRKRNGLYNEDRPLWQRLPYLLSPNQWMLISGTAMLLFSLSLLARSVAASSSFSWKGKQLTVRLLRYTSVTALIIVFISIPAAVYGYRDWDDAVVLADTRLRISPFTEAASAGAIQEGRIVRPVKQHNTFILVTDNSGRKGWLERKQLGFINELEDSASSR